MKLFQEINLIVYIKYVNPFVFIFGSSSNSLGERVPGFKDWVADSSIPALQYHPEQVE